MSTSTLIFIHIPKSAGTTLLRILETRFRKDEMFHFFVTQVEKMRSRYTRETFNDVYQQILDLLINMEPGRREGLKLLHGHVPYGIHQYLPSQTSYVTILREPLDRVISNFYYAMQKKGTYLYEKAAGDAGIFRDYGFFEDFLTREDGFTLNNFQTVLLSGIQGYDPLDSSKVTFFRKPDAGSLQLAKENLDKFSEVGLTERFDETLLLFKKTLGWEHFPYYEKANVTARRPGRAELPNRTLRLLEKHNELDCELYDYAKKIFEKRILNELRTSVYTGDLKSNKESGRQRAIEKDLNKDALLEKMKHDLLIQCHKTEGAVEEVHRLRKELDKKNEYISDQRKTSYKNEAKKKPGNLNGDTKALITRLQRFAINILETFWKGVKGYHN